MLIGITGKAGAGKDTAAAALIKNLGYQNLPFAAPLKDSCIFKFGLSHDDVYTQEGKVRFVPEWGMTVGKILQLEGTEATKNFWGEDFWVKRWRMDYTAFQELSMHNIVVTDCRFEAEAEALTEMGGRIIRIVRPDAKPLEGRDPNHASERGIDDKFVTLTIVNDGTMRSLRTKVLDAVKEWNHG